MLDHRVRKRVRMNAPAKGMELEIQPPVAHLRRAVDRRPDFAQAGGRDPSKLPEALGQVVPLVEELTKGR